MTKAEFIAELRGIDTGGSPFASDPEVWGAIIGAYLSVKHYQEAQRKERQRKADPSDNSNDDGA